MAVTFPANPVNGQEYTINNITYVYNSASDYWRDLGRAASTGNGNSTGGVTVYALAEDLPVINVAEGAMALVQETDKLFVYNNGWYNIAMINTAPTVTGISSSYNLAHDGTATVITVVGTDSENVPLTYTYSATGLATIATISQSGNQFTITPSTSADDAGTFSVTFTVTDGVNAVDTISSFTLSFVTQITDTKYNVALVTSSGTVGTSTDITDNSSSSHNITVGGDAHLTSLTPYRGGGYSTYFDGTGDYLTLSSPQFGYGSGDFTVEGWFYWNDWHPTNYSMMFISYDSGSVYFMLHMDAGTLRLRSNDTGINVTDSGTWNKNQWYHVALTREGSVYRVFQDGTEVLNTDTTYAVGNYTTLDIGGWGVADRQMNGYISDFRIVNSNALYTSNFTPPTERLEVISNTALLTCHRGWLGDASNNRHSITVNGNANTQPFGPYDSVEYNATNQGGSIYTDGTTGDRVQVASSTDFAFGTGDFTIEGWFDLPSIGTNDYLFDIGTNGLYVRFVSGVLTYFNGTNNQTTGTTSSLLPVNSWNHIALVRNSGSTTMYINGKSVPGITGITDTVDWTNSATVTLMDYGAGSAGVETQGFVSDFRITKGSAVYTADFLPTDVVVSNTTETVLHIKAGNADIVDKTQSVQLTLNGNTTTSNAVTKYENSSIYFDGSADNITFPVSAYGTGDFTVEAWVYPLASSNRFSQVFYVTNDMSVQYNHEDHPGVFRILYSGTAVTSSAASTDQWYHIAVVRSGTTVTLYIDGTSVGTHTYASDVPAFQQYLGGNYTISTDLAWNGYMEDFRITKGLARYTTTFTPPTQSLQA